jgi:alpha-beta hydrolase superfamily lysophospholipase
MSRARRAVESSLAVLNGILGDYLVRSGNALATPTELFATRCGERPLGLTGGIASDLPGATGRLVVLVHGLASTEGIFEMADGGDYGTRLAEDLGFTPLYVRYNSGRPIGENGVALSETLASLTRAYPIPVEEIVLLAHSMGGLVVRSACHEASTEGGEVASPQDETPWLGKVTRAIYLGTPHLGAPLERIGRVVTKALRAVPDPYTQLVADIASLRSEGMQDLGHADLRAEDRARRVGWSIQLDDPRHPVPLLPQIQHYLVAGSLGEHPLLGALLGDAIVPVESATAGLDGAALPPGHVRRFPGMNHLEIARSPAVYEDVRAWCAGQETTP